MNDRPTEPIDELAQGGVSSGEHLADELTEADTRVTLGAFGSFEQVVEGWYWAMRSSELKKGKVAPLVMMGRDLVIYRGDDGVVRVMDAYCPHMGAHLAEGRVDGRGVRCFFHHWRFNEEGVLDEVPCAEHTPKASIKRWESAEKYGMIWVWVGGEVRHPVPFIPELDGEELDCAFGAHFHKGCHPNIVMINAIDEQHFRSVHPIASSLAEGLHFKVTSLNDNCIMFDNQNKVPKTNFVTRLLGRMYAGPLTYRMVYWNGSTGSVTVGPDFWHFHIVFALRPTADGRAEGQTILVTKRRPTIFGWLLNRIALGLTAIVGAYFGHGDTRVFETIKWKFSVPIKLDRPIIHFAKHLEKQRFVGWGSWGSDDTHAVTTPKGRRDG